MAQKRDSKGRYASGGVGVGAVVLALAVAAGTGAGISASAGSTAARSSGNARSSDQDSVRTVARLTQRGLTVVRHTRADTDCAAHSYGRVRVYFQGQPCTALLRARLETRDVDGVLVLVSVAWVDMPDATRAAELQRLVDGDGTGNVTELSREQGDHTGVRFDGEHYASARDGATVVIVQAQPVGSGPGAAALDRIVTAALG